jgi:hypothetical protein
LLCGQVSVLSLSKADRSRLLERLIASLYLDPDAEEEWETLAEPRDADLEAGAVRLVALEEEVTRLRAKFPGCRSGFKDCPIRRAGSFVPLPGRQPAQARPSAQRVQ